MTGNCKMHNFVKHQKNFEIYQIKLYILYIIIIYINILYIIIIYKSINNI